MTSFFQDRKILVTGGTGFIGFHFVEALLELGARVRVTIHNRMSKITHPGLELLQADLANREACLRACQGVDCIVHAAGSVGSAGVSSEKQISGICENLVLTARMVDAGVSAGVKRLLLFSSSTTYPAGDQAFAENEMWEGPPHPAYFGYGWMRRYFELLAEYTTSNAELAIALCRPTAVYGPHDNFSEHGSHVMASLIRRAVGQENPFVVWGSGLEMRDFLHVQDLVRGCLLLLEHYAVCEPINLGAGQAIAIKDLVPIILEAARHSGATVVFDQSKPVTIPVRRVDVTKAEKILGFRPSISLQEGIGETINWYKREVGLTT